MTIFEKAVDQIAPHLRDGALVVLRSTVYPGTTGYVAQHLAERGCDVDVAFCPERIAEGHALEELHTLPADHRRGRRRGRRARRGAVRPLGAQDDPDRRPRRPSSTKLFTNTWRYMKFAVANQFFMIADQAGVDYTNILRAIREDYPRAADLPGPGLRRRSVPVQGHDAARRLHQRPLPARPGGDAGQRGPARLHRVGAQAPLRPPAGMTRRHPRHGVQGRVATTPARRSATSCASSSTWAGARVLCTDPYVDDERLVPLDDVLAERDILVIGAPHRAYRGARCSAASDVVDVWNVYGEGIRLSREGPRHRRRRVHRGLPRRGAARRRPRGRRARQLQQVRAPSIEVVRRRIPATGSSRATPRTSALMTRARRRLRPLRRRGGDDRRDQLLPRVRLRPAGRERADHWPPTFDAAIAAHRDGHAQADHRRLRRRWSTRSPTVFPTPEGAQLTLARRRSRPTASRSSPREYFAQGAWEQYQLPYTIVRPFNCVGDRRAPGPARHGRHERATSSSR